MLLKLILTKTLTILVTMIRKSCGRKNHNPANEVVRYRIDKHRRKKQLTTGRRIVSPRNSWSAKELVHTADQQ